MLIIVSSSTWYYGSKCWIIYPVSMWNIMKDWKIASNTSKRIFKRKQYLSLWSCLPYEILLFRWQYALSTICRSHTLFKEHFSFWVQIILIMSVLVYHPDVLYSKGKLFLYTQQYTFCFGYANMVSLSTGDNFVESGGGHSGGGLILMNKHRWLWSQSEHHGIMVQRVVVVVEVGVGLKCYLCECDTFIMRT